MHDFHGWEIAADLDMDRHADIISR